jgi:hypothetical protein
MHIDIAPETERLVREEISSGHVRSIDELIKVGVQALREKHARQVGEPAPRSLVQFFRESPLVGLELEFDREQDTGRDISL